MKFLKNNWLVLLLFFLFLNTGGLAIFKFLNPEIKEVIKTTIETKIDTVVKTDTLNIDRWYAKLDTTTITINDTIYQVPVASADTLIEKDSSYLSVRYLYPPINAFEIDWRIRNRIIHKTETITKAIRVKSLFELSWGLQLGGGFGLISQKPDIYVGIGLNLKVNL